MATVVTYLGEEWVAQRMAGTGDYSANNGSHIGWGTGVGVATKSDTTLFVESADPTTRAATTVTVEGTGVTAKYHAEATLTSNTEQDITNAGLFDANTAGNMFAKGDFDAIALGIGDQITFTITINPS